MNLKLHGKIARFVLLLCVVFTQVEAFASDDLAGGDKKNLVTLNFPENLELKVLIDYVGKRHGINFIYDEQIGNQKITIKAAHQLPADSLMTLLESALKMKGFSLSHSDIDGMMKIERAVNLTVSSAGLDGQDITSENLRPTVAVTRIISLKHITTQRAEQLLSPFLSAATANITQIAEHNMIILTDYAGNMKRLGNLLNIIDKPGREVQVSFVDVQHMPANTLSQQLSQLLTAKNSAQNPSAGSSVATNAIIQVNQWKNQLIVIGTPDSIAEVVKLVKAMDLPLELETHIYSLRTVTPDRLDEIITELIGEQSAEKLYRSVVDKRSNSLIVTASKSIHDQIEQMKTQLDKPLDESQSPIRFYKLENASAANILSTLENIDSDNDLDDVSVDGLEAESDEELESSDVAGDENGAVKLSDARIMADEATNTIIIVAKPAQQAMYERLIRRLDTRRPQVLLEATVITVDTTDEFELGVELSHVREGLDAGDVLTFTSFGLTAPALVNGAIAGGSSGFNGMLDGTLFDSDIADVIIHAIETDSRVKVTSRPTVLVNDNATGELVSESEEPYANVNISSTAPSVTTFGGYASAGTNISITPHISESRYLKLEYEITLSSFNGDRIATGDETGSLPPSRNTNTIKSEVTIPDGYTIVVGGLTRESLTKSRRGIPFLSRIPLLGYVFSDSSDDKQSITLFVFIRAKILREDKFEDLKILSNDAAIKAELGQKDYPESEPVLIR